MPPRKRARFSNVAGWPRRRRAWKKQPYGRRARRSGVRYNRGSVRPSVGRPVVAPLVHRRLNSELLTPIPVTAAGLAPLNVFVPDASWGMISRGMDVGETTSNAIRSRNVTFNFRINPPEASVTGLSYEFRIIQGFCKIPVFAEIQPSAAAQAAYDGICVDFDHTTAWKAHVTEQVNSALGNVDGSSFPSGNISSELIRVVSDKTHIMNQTSIQENGAAADTFKYDAFDRNYQFRTNTRMRLYPTSATTPPAWNDTDLCPLNNAGLQIRFLVCLVKNFAKFTVETARPFTQGTWTHYWVD